VVDPFVVVVDPFVVVVDPFVVVVDPFVVVTVFVFLAAVGVTAFVFLAGTSVVVFDARPSFLLAFSFSCSKPIIVIRIMNDMKDTIIGNK
jgi:hypothetical protein